MAVLRRGGGEFLPHPVVPGRSIRQGKTGTARGAGRRQAVPRGPGPQAHKPHRGREFRQFQPGAAEVLIGSTSL